MPCSNATVVSWKDVPQPQTIAFSAICQTRKIPFLLNLNNFLPQPVITRSKAEVSGFDVTDAGDIVILQEDSSLHIVRVDQSKIMNTSCVAYLCWFCGDDFRDKLSHNNHTVMHDNVPAECNVCLAIFKDKVFMTRHRINCFLKCDNCSFKSKYSNKIKSHSRSNKCK